MIKTPFMIYLEVFGNGLSQAILLTQVTDVLRALWVNTMVNL